MKTLTVAAFALVLSSLTGCVASSDDEPDAEPTQVEEAKEEKKEEIQKKPVAPSLRPQGVRDHSI